MTEPTINTLLCVRWTIPGSDVAWEWVPDLAVIYAGSVTGDQPASPMYLTPTSTFQPAWTRPETRNSLQALRDTTASFAAEANVPPRHVVIYWIYQFSAVSWDRSSGHLYEHRVSLGDRGFFGVVVPGRDSQAMVDDLASANEYARRVLGQAVAS